MPLKGVKEEGIFVSPDRKGTIFLLLQWTNCEKSDKEISERGGERPRRQLKIPRSAEYFWHTFKCLEMWSNTVLSVWYIFTIETKTEEKQNRKKIYANWDQISKHRHRQDELLMSLKMYIDAFNPISFTLRLILWKFIHGF